MDRLPGRAQTDCLGRAERAEVAVPETIEASIDLIVAQRQIDPL